MGKIEVRQVTHRDFHHDLERVLPDRTKENVNLGIHTLRETLAHNFLDRTQHRIINRHWIPKEMQTNEFDKPLVMTYPMRSLFLDL
mmetsp:Transcript_25029/g.34858  ORF Transcript_25029/g.34858 Transcript_25029/m.34858 type:complete len:86 (+) Transcript_25029:1490-1747(+)